MFKSIIQIQYLLNPRVREMKRIQKNGTHTTLFHICYKRIIQQSQYFVLEKTNLQL